MAYSSITAQLYTFGCGVFSVSQRLSPSLNPESHRSALERNGVVGFGRGGPLGRGGRGRGASVFYRPGIAFLKQPHDPGTDEENYGVQDDIAPDDYHNLGQRQHGAPPLSGNSVFDRRSESVETSEDTCLSEFRPRLLRDIIDGVAIKNVWMVDSTLVIQLVDKSLHFTRMVNSFMLYLSRLFSTHVPDFPRKRTYLERFGLRRGDPVCGLFCGQLHSVRRICMFGE